MQTTDIETPSRKETRVDRVRSITKPPKAGVDHSTVVTTITRFPPLVIIAIATILMLPIVFIKTMEMPFLIIWTVCIAVMAFSFAIEQYREVIHERRKREARAKSVKELEKKIRELDLERQSLEIQLENSLEVSRTDREEKDRLRSYYQNLEERFDILHRNNNSLLARHKGLEREYDVRVEELMKLMRANSRMFKVVISLISKRKKLQRKLKRTEAKERMLDKTVEAIAPEGLLEPQNGAGKHSPWSNGNDSRPDTSVQDTSTGVLHIVVTSPAELTES